MPEGFKTDKGIPAKPKAVKKPAEEIGVTSLEELRKALDENDQKLRKLTDRNAPEVSGANKAAARIEAKRKEIGLIKPQPETPEQKERAIFIEKMKKKHGL